LPRRLGEADGQWFCDAEDASPGISRREGDVIMLNLDDAIRSRHSTRMFLPQKTVPRELVDEALALAQCAPSNSDIQPWHIYFVSGARPIDFAYRA
jgi:hypothetical protein